MRLVEGGHVHAALLREKAQQVGSIRGGTERLPDGRNEHLAFARGNDVRKRRQRLRVHERHGAADDDERMALRPFRRVSRHAGEPQQREDVDVVPFERHGKREHVEVAGRRLRFKRQQRRAARDLLGELLLRRQEHSLAHHIVLRVEQAIQGLEAEVRHPDPVRVRKREGDAQTIAVRFDDVTDFFGEGLSCAFALSPGIHGRGRSSGNCCSDVGVLVCRGSTYSTIEHASRPPTRSSAAAALPVYAQRPASTPNGLAEVAIRGVTLPGGAGTRAHRTTVRGRRRNRSVRR